MTPRKSPETEWREVEGRIVVLHQAQGRIHELNEVGSRIWSLVDGVKTEEEIASEILNGFDYGGEEKEEVVSDVREFLSELSSKNLLLS